MAIWYKQGVFGDLTTETSEGMRKTERLYAANKEDVYVTSIRDGAHKPGSFHPHGRAWDMRKGNVSVNDHKKELGKNFDVIDEADHRHVEYDPKWF